MAIPRIPPPITRKVGIRSFEPAVFALIIPVARRPRIVKATMLVAAAPGVGANAPANGMRPPAVNEIAEATAA
jgi:hypothetical protein